MRGPGKRQGGERVKQQLRGAMKARIQNNEKPQKEISPVF